MVGTALLSCSVVNISINGIEHLGSVTSELVG
jgi:hypothetical protein